MVPMWKLYARKLLMRALYGPIRPTFTIKKCPSHIFVKIVTRKYKLTSCLSTTEYKIPRLHVVDAGTGYLELAIVNKRSAEVVANTMEVIWILKHGAPVKFWQTVSSRKGP